ncbi:MAG: hypothetical protein U0T83_03635 [Bacteriovoracaceae bacterium]
MIKILLIFFSFNLFAEYRVYQYFVKPVQNLPQDSNAYLVTSSLSPQSYLAYHGGVSAMKLNLLRTWMCPGFTGINVKYVKAPTKK